MAAKTLSEPERRALLEEMSALDPDKVFLPLPEHRRVLDDRVVLVLGERGVGKSALFHLLQRPEGAGLLGHEEKTRATRRSWIVGFSETKGEHASPLTLEEIARGPGPVEDKIRRFWLGHLIGRIATMASDNTPEPPPFFKRWKESPTTPEYWLSAIEDLAPLVLWLDRLEEALAAQERTLVVTYDHLDKIGVRSRDLSLRVLPPLLTLWLSLSSRYRHLRTKIFLRWDLFDEAVANTEGVSKLLNRAEELKWSVSALYRLLIRHLVAHDRLRKWLMGRKWKLQLTQHPLLGWMPPEDLPEEGSSSQARLMSYIVGERMGRNDDPRAGYSWLWVPNHLKDKHGNISPRSMITLFKSAAGHALNVAPLEQYTHLLAPEELKAGLHEASRARVDEMREEYPVIMRLKLLKDISLPASLSDVTDALSRAPEEDEDGFGMAGERILDELSRLGVIFRLPKDRIDIPDIYRLHFAIDRKGQKVTPGR